ncbi:MAG TPA: PP2C family protein-serine/threonine phosphatase [Pseudonocardiaceae bacterium]|nr:PP2C family protein-serine/threonine phosphatase [Pseudonocardiaceae bacterium]
MASDMNPVADLLVPGLPRLLDGMNEAVIVQDACGRIHILNMAARRLFPELGIGDEWDNSGDSFVAESGGRRVSGRLQRLIDGWQAWVVTEVSEAGTAKAAAESADHHDFMLAAGREFAAGVAHDAAAVALVRMAVPVLGEQAAVLLPAPRARLSWWRFGHGEARPARGTSRAPAPRTAPVLANALRGVTGDMTTVPADELVALTAALGPDVTEQRPVVATPLRGPQRTEGLLVVVRPVATELIPPLAALAGPALAAGRQRRARAAALTQLQAPLLPLGPEALPELPGVQLGVAHRAAPGELAVGGDFYLVRPITDDYSLCVLGDVCGKGAEALAESSRVQHSLAALMVVEQEPARLLHLLNRALLAAGRTVFTTLVLGAMQPVSTGLMLTLSAGGHPPPLVLRDDGHVEEVAVPGTVVGILPDARFGRISHTLKPGETCLLYSDGVTEAARRTGEQQEQFGPARLAACLRGCAGMTAQAVASRVEDTVTDWLGLDDGDDLAVLAIQAVAQGT